MTVQMIEIVIDLLALRSKHTKWHWKASRSKHAQTPSPTKMSTKKRSK